MYHDAASTSEAFGYVTITIVPDCSIETVTPAAIADITYTFDAVATTSIFSAYTSSFPSKCLIEYSLLYKDPITLVYGATTSIDLMISYSNLTNSLTVDYHVDNRYSQLNIDNIYEMKLTGCLWGDVC